MTEVAPESLVDMARQVIEEARDAWLRDHQQDFTSTVEKLMDTARDDLILNVLGFERDTFGRGKRWGIDHCNGRSGNSFVGKEITERAMAAVTHVLNKALEDWEPPQEVLNSIRAEFTQEVSRKVREYARNAGAKRAQEIVNQLVADL